MTYINGMKGGVYMQEIIIDVLNFNQKCYIDDLPIVDLVPKEQIDIVATSLARKIIEIIKDKGKRKQYYINSKNKKKL